MENLFRYKADLLYGDKLESANSIGDFEFFITSRPQITKAQRRNNNVAIAGRDGDLIRDDDSYDNVDISLECIIKSKTQANKQNDIDKLYHWLNRGGYQKLQLYFRDEVYWMACFQGNFAYDNKKSDNLYTKISISFTAKPNQLKLKSDTIVVSPITASFNVPNNYGKSKPIFHVTGKGNFEIKVTDSTGKVTTIEFKDISEANGALHVDTELYIAYYGTPKIPRSAEEFVLADEYPVFTNGLNKVEIKPFIYVTKLEIEPRWAVL